MNITKLHIKMNIEPNHIIIDYKKLYEKEHKKTKKLNQKLKEHEILIKYMNAKCNTLLSSNNKGEKDEILLLIELFYLNETKQYNKLVNIFGEEANNGITLLDINKNIPIMDIFDIKKTKNIYKADCIIKMNNTNYIYYPSIKSINNANPSIINHTHRAAKVFQPDGILNKYLDTLDIIVNEYNKKRYDNIFKQDVMLSKFECLNDPNINTQFKEILSYFLFDGTGKGYSKCKANSIMICDNNADINIKFIKCCDLEQKKSYIDTIINKCEISLRNKGMLKNMHDYCIPWIYNYVDDNNKSKLKGSLHIRLN